MNYSVIPTQKFEKEIKRLIKKFPSLKKEYSNLIVQLQTRPDTGTPVGTDCYKIRLAIASKGRGKSGGARIITYVVIAETVVFLLHIYDKSEQENISDSELEKLIKQVKK